MYRLVAKRDLRVLNFDCECRPLHWFGGDRVSKELTAIAWAFTDPKHPRRPLGDIEVRVLRLPDPECETLADYFESSGMITMLRDFVAAYNEADVVVGHFIKGYDLSTINGQLFECGLPLLRNTLAQDTKEDLPKLQGLSKSQENLGGTVGLRHPKVGMSQADWRIANRLMAEGLRRTERRVVGDVAQNIELRAELLSRGALSKPRMWSGSSLPAEYAP